MWKTKVQKVRYCFATLIDHDTTHLHCSLISFDKLIMHLKHVIYIKRIREQWINRHLTDIYVFQIIKGLNTYHTRANTRKRPLRTINRKARTRSSMTSRQETILFKIPIAGLNGQFTRCCFCLLPLCCCWREVGTYFTPSTHGREV